MLCICWAQSDVFGVKSKDFRKIRQIRLFMQGISENLDCPESCYSFVNLYFNVANYRVGTKHVWPLGGSILNCSQLRFKSNLRQQVLNSNWPITIVRVQQKFMS